MQNFPESRPWWSPTTTAACCRSTASSSSAWHRRFDFQRPLAVMVHDMVMRFAGWIHRLGGVPPIARTWRPSWRPATALMIYPGGSRETFRPFWGANGRRSATRTGFVKRALRYRVPITPSSPSACGTFFVLWRGAWLANRLGITRHLRA